MNRFARKIFVLLVCGLLTAMLGPLGVEAREVQMMMALDVSGSMKTNDPQRLLPKAAHIMVELLDGKDRLGVLSFDEATATRLASGPLTPDHKRRGFQALADLQPKGLFTDIHQVLTEALKGFEPPGETRRVLLLISDGEMDIDPAKGDSKKLVERVHQEVIPAYQKAKIPIYTVAFSPAADQVLLKVLAEKTGGQFLLITAAKDLHQPFTKFYEALKGPQVAPLVGNHFVIDSQVQEAILVVTRANQAKPVVLETPKRQKLTPASSGVRWFAAPTFDMVTIPKPEPGTWMVSGHKEGDGKIILMTDLKLESLLLPEEAGADEALTVGATLINKGQAVSTPEVLKQTVFVAELNAEGGKPLQLQMGTPPLDQKDLWPAAARVACFPVFSTPGVWHLKIRAMGKTFLRERNFSVKVVEPWLKAQAVPGAEPAQVEFRLASGREAAELGGWFTITGPARGLAGVFVSSPTGGGFRFAFPPELAGPHQISLQLTGATASGRPLALKPPPLSVNLTPPAAASGVGPKSAAAASSPGTAPATVSQKRKWLLLGLALVVAAAVLAALGYFFRNRVRHFILMRFTGNLTPDEMSQREHYLLLLAQVDSLQKDKGKLLADLKEMTEAMGKLVKEKEKLEASITQPDREYQEKSKMIKELEQKLEEAENEAKSVQEEYMALYARSQAEKQVIKKG